MSDDPTAKEPTGQGLGDAAYVALYNMGWNHVADVAVPRPFPNVIFYRNRVYGVWFGTRTYHELTFFEVKGDIFPPKPETERSTDRGPLKHVGVDPQPPVDLHRLAKDLGGRVTEGPTRLPDGSGFAVMSLPLPKDHWSVVNPETVDEPPMPFRMGVADHIESMIYRSTDLVVPRPRRWPRNEFEDRIRAAGKYAYRASTMNGREPDLDPDALLQNLVVGFCGYHTADGWSHLDGPLKSAAHATEIYDDELRVMEQALREYEAGLGLGVRRETQWTVAQLFETLIE